MDKARKNLKHVVGRAAFHFGRSWMGGIDTSRPDVIKFYGLNNKYNADGSLK